MTLLKVGFRLRSLGLGLRSSSYDPMMRPLNTNGQPAFDNLFAAGIILAHQDWARMKCGSGLSIATAYGAVKALPSA